MLHDLAMARGADLRRATARVEELEGELTRRLSQLQATNRELEAFAYSVSHDLRAPLRAIEGFSRILVEEYESSLAPDAQRYLQYVRDNAVQMGDLITHLLTFSRVGREPLRKQSVAPAQMVHDVLEELLSGENGRQVEVAVGNLAACQADPALLRQVWANLLSNALKFTRQRELAVIDVGCQNGTDAHVYFVRDNGAGFDMQYADRLFSVFQRLHRMEEFEGTGVGLATVQRIIHRHGGRIWAEAQVDRGATFYFTL
jgi:light-regulated signal transduction histidine kinase (bacteriophytochrome)